MFFVISGLIIYHAHRCELGDPRNVPRYLKKRVARIYPFYWIVFLVLGGRKVFTGRLAIGDFLTNALLFSSSKPLVVAVSWTLAYEMIFYALFVAFFFRRSLGAAVFAAWFALLALNQLHPFVESLALGVINALFLLGLLTSLAVIAIRARVRREPPRLGRRRLAGRRHCCLPLHRPVLPLVARAQHELWFSLPLTLGFGAGSALLLAASASDRIEAFLERQKPLMLIGDASYSIYLVHFYFEKRTANAIRSLGWIPPGDIDGVTALLLLAALLIAAVAGGILVHKLIEKPVLTRSRQWLGLGEGVRQAP